MAPPFAVNLWHICTHASGQQAEMLAEMQGSETYVLLVNPIF
jgi:hypothetical protein